MPARNLLRAPGHLVPLYDEPWRLCTRCECPECEDQSFFCLLRQWNERRRIERVREYGVWWLVPVLARVEVRE